MESISCRFQVVRLERPWYIDLYLFMAKYHIFEQIKQRLLNRGDLLFSAPAKYHIFEQIQHRLLNQWEICSSLLRLSITYLNRYNTGYWIEERSALLCSGVSWNYVTDIFILLMDYERKKKTLERIIVTWFLEICCEWSFWILSCIWNLKWTELKKALKSIIKTAILYHVS